MLKVKQIIITGLLSLALTQAFANNKGCCADMGGVSYCDSSAGRIICKNGFFSTCYCTIHAVMDLQFLRGCCLWKGGIRSLYESNLGVLCNDGSISEECSIGQMYDP